MNGATAPAAEGVRPRLAVIGIGQELCGDDGAGCAVVAELQARCGSSETLLALDGGCAPENQTGPLRRFRPSLVVMVDAAEMGTEPGSIGWLAWEDTLGLGASTHTLPAYVLGRFLSESLRCDVALIGIQPANLSFGAPLSPAVRRAVEEVSSALVQSQSNRQPAGSSHVQ